MRHGSGVIKIIYQSPRDINVVILHAGRYKPAYQKNKDIGAALKCKIANLCVAYAPCRRESVNSTDMALKVEKNAKQI